MSRRCIYVERWTCNVAPDEIPLEVCRVCIEARKVSMQTVTPEPKPSAEPPKRTTIDRVELDRVLEEGDAREILSART